MKYMFVVKCNPPKSTASASSQIMKRKDGTQFVGKMQGSKAKFTQNAFMTLLAPYVPDKTFEGPLAVDVMWVYPFRKTEKKKNMEKAVLPCDKRPDIDNLCKMFFDCMSMLGFWKDDSQVSVLSFIKCWGQQPGIYVRIEDGIFNITTLMYEDLLEELRIKGSDTCTCVSKDNIEPPDIEEF